MGVSVIIGRVVPAFGLAATVVFATFAASAELQQEPSEGEPSKPPAPTATLHVLLFERTRPLEGVRVRAKSVEATTGTDGAVWLTVTPGLSSLVLEVPEDTLSGHPGPRTISLSPFEAEPGAVVQAIVTLDDRGELRVVDLEGARQAGVVRSVEKSRENRPIAAPPGTIRGRVVAQETQRPIAGARVYVRGAPVEATTDAQGMFSLTLPEGHYGLAVIHSDYSTETVAEVSVKRDETTPWNVELTPASVTLDDFVVTAPHIQGGIAALLDERRESSSVSDVIGAEEMSRTGDSDAAGALRRVTGITVIGGKYVYVRGMGERYSSTLLNGQMIPSPEPERRVVPLDLFPTDVLESVVIQKTFSPDSPAEFGGGVVQLRTRSYPEKLTLSFKASVGYNSETTFRRAPTHDGGSRDWLGMDDGSRALPEEVRSASPIRAGDRFQAGYTDEDRARFARMLANNWNVSEATVPPARGFGASIGNTFHLGEVPVGFVLSLFYDDDYQLTKRLSRRYGTSDAAEGGIQEITSFDIRSFERVVSSGGILVAGSEYAKGHRIKSTTLLLRITDMSTDVVAGVDAEDYDIRWSRLRFVERQMLTQQVVGEQELLDGLRLDWRYAYSKALRDEPDRREYYYRNEALTGQSADYQLSGRPDGNVRSWSQLEDRIHDFGADVAYRFEPWKDREAMVKAGASRMARKRNVDTIRLTFNGSLPADVRRGTPNEVFSEKNIGGENGWLLNDVTQGTDAYEAEQSIDAAFLMTELPIAQNLSWMGGVRLENSQQTVSTFDPFSNTTPIEAEVSAFDWLPATTVTWRFRDDMSVRGGFGRTVSRPDFRELSQASFLDVTTGTRYFGNPELERAVIDNYDTRFEWYFSSDELLSVGAFYKRFQNPIEQVVAGGTDISLTWNNAEAATNAGLELEARSRLAFLSASLQDFYGSVNVAVIRSNVELGDQAAASTSKSRPLQGQSPYVINAQFGYDDAAEEGNGIQAALLYNRFGPRISEVGRFGLPDVYERPNHRLDAVYAQRLGKGLQLKAKASNLLNPTITFEQADRVVQEFSLGRDVSLELSWTN